MRSSSSLASNPTLPVLAGACLVGFLLIGIAAVIILSIIPTFTPTQDFTPTGERYCIDKLQLFVTFNASAAYSLFTSTLVNTSFPLSQACYRILQNYKRDTLLRACLLANCSFTNVSTTNANMAVNMTCDGIVYYNARCSDQGPQTGLNNYISSSGNSGCRAQRMAAINGALGSTSTTQYTNIPTLSVANIFVPILNVTTSAYSNYSQLGTKYCGSISQSAIATAINAQATG